jgi:hypothetical protein
LASDLAAGGSRDAAGPLQHSVIDLHLEHLCHCLPHGLAHLVQVGPPSAALQFLDDYQALLIFYLDRKGRPGAGLQCGVGALDDAFNVLRVKVAASQDDQVLEPSRYVEPVPVEEAQVAAAQEGALARIVLQAGLEAALSFLGTVPVADSHAGALDPDLSHSALRAGTPVRVDDLDPMSFPAASAAHKALAGRLRGHRLSLFQLVGIQAEVERSLVY